MTRKKTGFFTFLFSLIPGAGEMYLGFFKYGISIMLLFGGLLAISSYLNIGPVLFVLPVIWFYSFFHVHNLNHLSDEDFYALEDTFLFSSNDSLKWKELFFGKYQKIWAIILILVGCNIIWNNLYRAISLILPNSILYMLNVLIRGIPQVIIALCIILGGIFLIREKKETLEQNAEDQS